MKMKDLADTGPRESAIEAVTASCRKGRLESAAGIGKAKLADTSVYDAFFIEKQTSERRHDFAQLI
jgi:hypothetical protein